MSGYVDLPAANSSGVLINGVIAFIALLTEPNAASLSKPAMPLRPLTKSLIS